ncbi:MAG: sulfatase [Spirochaetales bacterium]
MNRPNILFIMIDDLGWRDVSCFGSEFYETPNVDALAAEGMRFTDAYASCPVCSPTRASILAGKYPATLGLTNYIDWRYDLHPRKSRLIDAPYIRHLPHSEKTLATSFKESGYDTCHVGKWHLGGPDFYPDRHGFDENIGGCEWGMPMNGYFAPWGISTLEEGKPGEYLTDRLTTAAIRWIENRTSKPWFLNLWYYSVHVPIQGKKELVEKYEEKAREMGIAGKVEPRAIGIDVFDPEQKRQVFARTVQSHAEYAAMIESFDENIGRIVSHLKASGEWENTVVVFTSDNGGLSTGLEGGITSNEPLTAGKGWMYEGGTRVATVIRAPGVTAAGSTCNTPVTSTDFYPTLLELAGADLEPAQHTDGVSLTPLLSGGGTPKRDAIFWHFPHYSNLMNRPACSIRMGDWKLIQFFEDNHLELYNLRDDIGESHNLADGKPELRERMLDRLEMWKERVCARIPKPNPDWQPVASEDASDPSSPLV